MFISSGFCQISSEQWNDVAPCWAVLMISDG